MVQTPLSEPSRALWVSLYTPDPGYAVKDMDVVGDHCVLVVRTPASGLALIVVSLTRPKHPTIIKVSMTESRIN